MSLTRVSRSSMKRRRRSGEARIAAARSRLNALPELVELVTVAKRFRSWSRAAPTRSGSSSSAVTLPSACVWYQSKSTSSTAFAAVAASSEAASPSVQAVTLYWRPPRGSMQVAEGRLARPVEVRAERPDREEQHDHHGQDAGGGQQHQQSLPAQPRALASRARASRDGRRLRAEPLLRQWASVKRRCLTPLTALWLSAASPTSRCPPRAGSLTPALTRRPRSHPRRELRGGDRPWRV